MFTVDNRSAAIGAWANKEFVPMLGFAEVESSPVILDLEISRPKEFLLAIAWRLRARLRLVAACMA